jgi:hypothetical protein
MERKEDCSERFPGDRVHRGAERGYFLYDGAVSLLASSQYRGGLFEAILYEVDDVSCRAAPSGRHGGASRRMLAILP